MLKNKLKRRRDHRILAVQQISAALISDCSKDEIIKTLFENADVEIENTFALDLIEGVLGHFKG